MIYRGLDDLCMALFEEVQDDRLPELVQTYFHALHNPPDGVIGVGAITYAEGVLLEKQQS